MATPSSASACPPPGAAGLFLPFRHRETERAFSGLRRARSGIVRIPVIKPHTGGINSGTIEGDIWRQVKDCETGGYGKSSTITTLYHTLGVQRQVMAGIGYRIMRPRIKSGATVFGAHP